MISKVDHRMSIAAFIAGGRHKAGRASRLFLVKKMAIIDECMQDYEKDPSRWIPLDSIK
jgi:hypothetical protein